MKPEELVNLCSPYSGISHDGLGRLYKFANSYFLPEGAVVQCGVVNGGSAVLLWHACRGGKRHLWMFDSFEGLPEPDSSKDGGRASSLYIYHQHAQGGWCVGHEEKAAEIANLAKVPQTQTHIVKGWFKDTLPQWTDKVGPIALLHLDVDWYQSYKECLDWLYPYLAPGGLLILDDYGYWPGCAEAAKDYGIDDLLTKTPPCGAWMVKEADR